MAHDHGDMDATVVVLHAIPEGSGVDVVDVYAGGAMLMDNFTLGSLETLTVPAGTHDLAVCADGESPEGDIAVLEAVGVKVSGGADVGDSVTVDLVDGSSREYEVVAREVIAKEILPTSDLFAEQGRERLTLISCIGYFDRSGDGYRENVVVTAVPITDGIAGKVDGVAQEEVAS
jgi:hypothetical protein